MPQGATLIENPVSAAPGFQIENVFVMAGIPRIMQAMFKSIAHRLSGGKPLLSRTIATNLGEGVLAANLGRLQDDFGEVEIGSYPSTAQGRMGVRVVLRSTDPETLAVAGEACRTMYPSTAQGRMGVRVVLRSTDPETLAVAGEACRTMVLALGGEAQELDYTA
jgi:molybdopterin-biosynthesis enzyme MoeA-like protein